MRQRQIDFARQLRSLMGARSAEPASDGQLLEHFGRDGDEGAFATLMRRYGPLVLGVCRRVLGDADDADDAFQATFLVLARKSSTVRKQKSIASWLYGTAYRVAREARACAARRHAHEREAAMRDDHLLITDDPATTVTWREIYRLLDDALHGLPPKYREPLVLCYLQDLSNAQAAQTLGRPVGSVSRLLARGRELLRERLAYRGVAVPGAVLAILLTNQAAPGAGAVPAIALQATARAASRFAAGAVLQAPAPAVALAERVLRSMVMIKVKAGALSLAIMGVLCLGVFAIARAPAHSAPTHVLADEPKRLEKPILESLGIRELRPEVRVTSPQAPPLAFHVVVSNPTQTEYRNLRLTVRLNGQEHAEASVPIPILPARDRQQLTFHLYLDTLGFQQIATQLENEGKPVEPDTTRYTIVEVRQWVPILLIDGDNTLRARSDRWYMESILFGSQGSPRRGVIPGYDVTAADVARLEGAGLDRYPSIFLCNVRELSDKALQNLDAYVKEGGSVAFLLGDRVNPEFYNKKLFADGQGLFPAPLADRPSNGLTEEEIQQREKIRLTSDAPLCLFLRDDRHRIFRGMEHVVFPVLFRYELNIDRHFPVAGTKWKPKAGQVLASLPNTHSSDDYKEAIAQLLERLPLEDPKYKAYATRLRDFRDFARNLLARNEPLHQVAVCFDELLNEAGGSSNAKGIPNLKEFWANDELAALKGEFERLRDAVKFGDPLLIEGQYGKGRVLVCTTTLGENWSNLATKGEFAVIFMANLESYLVGAPAMPNGLSVAEQNAAWSDLGAAPGTSAADRALTIWLALPRHSLAYFKEKLKAVPLPPAQLEETVSRSIEELDSKEFAVRRNATAKLRMLGMWAGPALRRALTRNPSIEPKKRIDELLDNLERLQELPVEHVQIVRAVEILGKLGTPEARHVLEQLANATPETWVNERARKALQ